MPGDEADIAQNGAGLAADTARPSRVLDAWRKARPVAYVLVGGAIAYAGVGHSPSHGGEPASVAAAPLLALVLLVLVSLISWPVSRWRERAAGRESRRRFRDVFTSWPAILVALALCVIYGVAGTIAKSNQEVTSNVQQERLAYGSWLRSWQAEVKDAAGARQASLAVTRGLQAKHVNFPRLIPQAQLLLSDAALYLLDTDSQHASTTAVRHIQRLDLAYATATVAAYTELARALQRRSDADLSKANGELITAANISKRLASQGDALYNRLGGASVFTGSVNFLWIRQLTAGVN